MHTAAAMHLSPNIYNTYSHIHTHLQYTQDLVSNVYPTGNATWRLGVVGDSNGVEELSCAPYPQQEEQCRDVEQALFCLLCSCPWRQPVATVSLKGKYGYRYYNNTNPHSIFIH